MEGVDVRFERGLVPLDGQDIVGVLLVEEIPGGLDLRMERVGGHHGARERERIEQGRHTGDLVRVGRHGVLRHDDAEVRQDGAQQVARGGAGGRRPAQGLAIERQRLAGDQMVTQQPRAEDGVEPCGVELLQGEPKTLLRRRRAAATPESAQ